MPPEARRIAWSCVGIAVVLHALAFCALDRWMRVGSSTCTFTYGFGCGPLPDEVSQAAEPEREIVLQPEEEVPPCEPFPEIPRAADEIVAASDAEPMPLPCLDTGVEQETAADPGDSLLAPGTIGLGAWGRGGNVRFGAARSRAPQVAPAVAAAPVPAAAIAPAPVGETRPPCFGTLPEPPLYPLAARRRGWEGVVRLRLEVGADGSVRSVEVVASSGRTLLDEAAVETARTWRLRPALADGIAVAGSLDVPVRFRLDS